jgi:hypothetical protein
MKESTNIITDPVAQREEFLRKHSEIREKMGPRITEAVCHVYGVTIGEILTKYLYGNLVEARGTIIYLMYFNGIPFKEISEDTGFSIPRISLSIQATRERIEKNPKYAKVIEDLISYLSHERETIQ